MSQELKQFIQQNVPKIESTMTNLIDEITAPDSLKDSMLYSLKAGGKRIRPLFVLAVLDLFNRDVEDGLTVGAVIEMIHTYSLIHDDLPSMDNDDFRRGVPTNHKVFGDALATLAGDALNTLSFGVLARMNNLSAEKRVQLIHKLSVAAGAEGMVGGQVLDIEGEQKKLTLQQLEQVHVNKTGALLKYSIEAGAILADATEAQLAALSQYAYHIGLAFQIQDDILDIEGTTEQLGKTAGKDIASEKSTYPALLTLAGAKEKLQEHYEFAIQSLEELPNNSQLLKDFADYIVRRQN